MTQEITIYITVGSSAVTDKQEIAELAEDLLYELRELDDISLLDPLAGNLPENPKGSPLDVWTLVAKIAEASGIPSLVSVIGSWLTRDRTRTLKFQIEDKSIEATGLSKDEQQELIKWFQLQAGLRLDR
jgi:hypothetical protein